MQKYREKIDKRPIIERANQEDTSVDLILAASGGVLSTFVCMASNFKPSKLHIPWLNSNNMISINIMSGSTIYKIEGLSGPYKAHINDYYRSKTEVIVGTYDRSNKEQLFVSNKQNSKYTEHNANEDNYLKAMIGSACIPLIFKPQCATIGGRNRVLVDGGVGSDSAIFSILNDRIFEKNTLKIIFAESNSVDLVPTNPIKEILMERYRCEMKTLEFMFKSWCRVKGLIWHSHDTDEPDLALASKNFLVFVRADVYNYDIEMTDFTAQRIHGVRDKITRMNYRCFFT